MLRSVTVALSTVAILLATSQIATASSKSYQNNGYQQELLAITQAVYEESPRRSVPVPTDSGPSSGRGPIR